MARAVLRKLEHLGMCDASAAVSLDDNYFVVASDEDSYLRVYRRHAGGKAIIDDLDVSDWLGLDSGESESEIEAAATLRGVTYWISSHGRNSSGKLRLDRHHFFGTRLHWNGNTLKVDIEGTTYHSLLSDLLSRSALSDYTKEQMQEKRVSALTPKQAGAVNIEGLCSYNGGLLIGFRNPIPNGLALAIPFNNPFEVIHGEEKAAFSEPLFWDLDGLGVRSVEYLEDRDLFLIVAGSFDSQRRFELFEWSGSSEETPIHITNLQDMNPESVVWYHGRKSVQILSDNGADRDHVSGRECKDLPSWHPKKRFESIWLSL